MKKKNLLLLIVISMIFLLPQTVLATPLDKHIKDGKFVFKSIKPKNEDELRLFYENLYYIHFTDDDRFYVDYCNDDLTRCEFLEEIDGDIVNRELEMVYEYDEDVKTVVEDLVNALPANKDEYALTELELISYLYNSNDFSSVADYSSELKKYIGYKNFGVDIRLGDDAPFYTERGGNALFTYDGTIYYNSENVICIVSNHVFYVPSDSTDIVEAIRTRLSNNFKGWTFDVIEMTIEEFITKERNSYISQYNDDPEYDWLQNVYASADEYANTAIEDLYTNDNAEFHYVMSEEHVYQIKINNRELFEGIPLYFTVKKDDSKIVDNSFISVDSQSNIVISTKENIPLDTLIQVAKITSGEQYDKIMQILSIANSEMFDLKLFSKSTGENITRLSDGTFEVKIPISQNLVDKDLTVYYVDEEDHIHEYAVTVKDGYAIFNTNHFSIYTLAETPEEPTFHVTYNFNGGNRQGETEYVTDQVAYGLSITKETFIDVLNVTPPEGKELDAIEINGTRTELGSDYLLNVDTVFKYLWKDIPNNTTNNQEEPTQNNPDVIQTNNTESTNTVVKTVNNPQTKDDILNYVVMLLISTTGMIGTIIFDKKLLMKKARI